MTSTKLVRGRVKFRIVAPQLIVGSTQESFDGSALGARDDGVFLSLRPPPDGASKAGDEQ